MFRLISVDNAEFDDNFVWNVSWTIVTLGLLHFLFSQCRYWLYMYLVSDRASRDKRIVLCNCHIDLHISFRRMRHEMSWGKNLWMRYDFQDKTMYTFSIHISASLCIQYIAASFLPTIKTLRIYFLSICQSDFVTMVTMFYDILPSLSL